jgi:hypothetical protein
MGVTLDKILALYPLDWWCDFFAWQGGTLHQARAALKTFYAERGIVEDKQGILVTLVIGPSI